MEQQKTMEAQEIDFLTDVLKKRTGIVVNSDKVYLLENRLKPIAEKFKTHNISELIKQIRTSNDETILRDVSNAMTTNETLFFRDTKPFEALKNVVIPELLNHKLSKIRIWCAACSTGQEPYSIAIALKEMGLPSNIDVEILATDINQEVLNKAREGLYSQFEVQRGLPSLMLVKYFSQQKHFWKISSEIKDMVTFKEFNLLDDMQKIGKQDVVFCRNVLIYFDQKTKKDIVERIRKQTNDNGFLFLGSSEALFSITENFLRDRFNMGMYRSN
ncbi:MAG: protein-glutamate O-methyltransferase CheR [Alphaproteobacteria bacterium]